MWASGALADEPPPAEEALPSAEMLMYLGEFEDAGGEFVDPLALEAASPPLAVQAHPRRGQDQPDDAEQGDD